MLKSLFLLAVLLAGVSTTFARLEYRAPFHDKAMARIKAPVLHLSEEAPVVLPGYGLIPFEVDRRRHHRHSRQVHVRVPRTPEQQYMGLMVGGGVITGVGIGAMVLGTATLPNDSADNPVSLAVLILGGVLVLVGTGMFLGGWYLRSNYKNSVEISIDE
jgi:hypothetical protein